MALAWEVQSPTNGLSTLLHKNGWVILNNASVGAKEPLGYEPIYNVTKAALVMLSKCLANELVGDNIRVNTVSPGPIMTPDWKKTATLLAAQDVPMHRFASPEEAANLFVFLVSSRIWVQSIFE